MVFEKSASLVMNITCDDHSITKLLIAILNWGCSAWKMACVSFKLEYRCHFCNFTFSPSSLLNCMRYVLLCQLPCLITCLRAYMLTCLHALCAYVLRAYVLTCLACLHAYVPCMLTCQRVLYVYVLTCQHLCMLCMSTSSHAITINDQDKFSITCFPYIFVIVLCLFPVK